MYWLGEEKLKRNQTKYSLFLTCGKLGTKFMGGIVYFGIMDGVVLMCAVLWYNGAITYPP